MKKKIIAFSIAGLLLTLGFTTYSYAKAEDNGSLDAGIPTKSQGTNSSYNSMIDLMKNNGFEDMAKAMENRDYNSMNNFMNNISEKDYESMINIMKDNGYAGMANAMKSIGKYNMIKMHNSMGGAQGMMFRK